MSGGRVGIVHVHSAYSRDGRDSLERLRELAIARGIAWVGLTDHAEDIDGARYTEMMERCRALSDERVTLIPGLEFRFEGHTGLHLLALGLARWIAPATPADFIREARGVARLTIAAHPVLFRYRLPDVVAGGIDAIEVWNASYNKRYLPDPHAIQLLYAVRARRPEVVATVGLDQHDAANDRGARILVGAGERDPLAAIRAGRFVNIGSTMRLDPYISLGPARLGALTAARWAFDRLERVHHYAVLAARRVRGRS